MKRLFHQGIAAVILVLFITPVKADTLIDWSWDYYTAFVRDIASSTLLKVYDVSPTALVGKGPGYYFQLRLHRNSYEHSLGIAIIGMEQLSYRAGHQHFRRRKDRLRGYQLIYRFRHGLGWKPLLWIDLSIGSEVRLSGTESFRYFRPDFSTDYTEQFIAPSLLLSLQTHPMKNLHLETTFINGGLFGRERTSYASDIKNNFLNGWVTSVDIVLTWRGSEPWYFSGTMQRRETVIIGQVYQHTASFNRWGLSVGYRWGEMQ